MPSSSEGLCTLVVETLQRSIYKIPDVDPVVLRDAEFNKSFRRNVSNDNIQVVNESGAFLSLPLRIFKMAWLEHKDGRLEPLSEKEGKSG